MMANETVTLSNREKAYDNNPCKQCNGSTSSLPSTTSPPVSNGSLQLKKPIYDNALCTPKGTIWKSTFNPNARAAQNENIVEDMAQAPCAMSTLEVLQHCPSQQ
jgi:hypothetical protein